MSHLPSPWHVDFGDDGAVIHNGVTIAKIPIDANAWKPNAILISSAPIFSPRWNVSRIRWPMMKTWTMLAP